MFFFYSILGIINYFIKKKQLEDKISQLENEMKESSKRSGETEYELERIRDKAFKLDRQLADTVIKLNNAQKIIQNNSSTNANNNNNANNDHTNNHCDQNGHIILNNRFNTSSSGVNAAAAAGSGASAGGVNNNNNTNNNNSNNLKPNEKTVSLTDKQVSVFGSFREYSLICDVFVFF